MIIGICGFLGSGKGTVADILSEKYNFQKISFADTLKDTVSVMFGWDRKLLEGDTVESRDFREKEDPFWTEKFGYSFTPRLALQLMGTEAGRNVFHKDFWIFTTEQRMKGKERVVIPDVRFRNEISFIQSKGGKVIRVTRGPEPSWFKTALKANRNNTGCKNALEKLGIHESEFAWIGSDFDYTIENDGTFKELSWEVEKYLDLLKKIEYA